MFVTIGLLVVACYLFYRFVTWNYKYWEERNVVGPKPKFFLGNFPSTLTQCEHQLYEVQRFYDQYKDEHPFIGVYSMRTAYVLLLAPETIRNVLIKDFKSFHDNEFADITDKTADPLLARNPFLLIGDEWKDKRAEITPAFTTNRIKALYPLIEEVCSRMTKYVMQSVAKEQNDGLNTRELAAKFTTDVVSSCVFAMDAGSFTKENPEIREVGRRLMDPNFVVVFKLMLYYALRITKKLFKFNFIPKDIKLFFSDLMHQALQYRKKNNITRADYLDHLILMKEKKNLSELDLAAHTVTFFLDGFDTSSVFIAHALYLLAANPDCQDTLRAEIEDALVDGDGSIGYEKLMEMPYLDQVCNESLRMYSPAAFLSRKCTSPFELTAAKDKKVLIEKDTPIMIPVHALHRDETYYKNPDRFDPERFSAENGGEKAYRDKGVFLPFGDGPRICLGMRFAFCQSKAAIVEIVRNFSLSVNKKTQVPITFDPKESLIFPLGGYWVNYTPIGK